MKRLRYLLLTPLLCWTIWAHAGIDTFTFDTPEQELRFQHLTEQLRCLVCQNQSLADSNAELAMDLRREVHKMILAGSTDAEIIDFLVSRYGDFVLYRPLLQSNTYLLWFGPFLLLAGGLGVWAYLIRRRGRRAPRALSEAEQERLRKLLEDGQA